MDKCDSIFVPLFALEPMAGIVDRVDFLCKQVAGRRVVHVGCADYPLTMQRMMDPNFLHRRLCLSALHCVGLDASRDALDAMRAAGFCDLVEGDACQLSQVIREPVDLIVAGEVLEHLKNPGLFFEEAARCLVPDGAVLVTVPNAFNILRIFHLLRNREMVHMDHCFYFSAKTLARLAAYYGFTLESVGYTDPLAAARRWPILTKLWRFFISRFPMLGQSVVAVFRRGNQREARSHIID